MLSAKKVAPRRIEEPRARPSKIDTDHLPRPLEPAARSRNRGRLIHDPLADTEVALDPSVELLVLA